MHTYVGKEEAKHVIPIFGTAQVIQREIWACHDSSDMTLCILIDAFKGTCCFYLSVKEDGGFSCLQNISIYPFHSVVPYDGSINPSKRNSP
jgi:hypothetical protein